MKLKLDIFIYIPMAKKVVLFSFILIPIILLRKRKEWRYSRERKGLFMLFKDTVRSTTTQWNITGTMGKHWYFPFTLLKQEGCSSTWPSCRSPGERHQIFCAGRCLSSGAQASPVLHPRGDLTKNKNIELHLHTLNLHIST